MTAGRTARFGRWGALGATALLATVVPAGSATACWWLFKANGEARRPAPAQQPQPAAAYNPPPPAPAPAPVDDADRRRADELERRLADRDAENRRLRDELENRPVPAANDPRMADLQRRLADAEAENRRLRDDLDRRLADRDAENRRLRDDLATRPAVGSLPREQVDITMAERDAEIARLRRDLDAERSKPAPAPVVVNEPFGKGTTTHRTDEQLTITIDDAILFDSGKADLKPGAEPTLSKISAFLRERHPDNLIEVLGHTDVQPIRHSGWQDNWHLSVARSTAVARDIMRRGVRPDNCKISGRSEYEPVGNDWARNRRVEIVVWLKKFGRGQGVQIAQPAGRVEAPIFK